MKKEGKSALYFVLVTILIDSIGFGIIIPVLPKLLSEMQSISISEASTYGGYLLTVFAVFQFIFSPIMGNLSDQYGRRPILIISLLGITIDYLLLAVAPTYAWLVIGRIVAGIFGASITTASAYIADISTDENREQNFGFLGAAFGLGFIIGPLLGGIFGEYGARIPFYVAAILSFANFLYGYFILPESLSIENRRQFTWKDSNPFATLKKLFDYKNISYILVAIFLMNLASHAVNTNWAYFTIFRFGWTESLVGISLTVAGIVIAITQAGLAQTIKNKLGAFRGIMLGVSLFVLGMISFALATSTWMMFVFLIPYGLGSMSDPLLRSYLVNQVPANEQGELQGGLTSIQSLTMILGPIVMTWLFFETTRESTSFYMPGSPFILAAFLLSIALVILYFRLKKAK
jgi:DHA1 family tetracycline resistance protein-like MFS transporter